MLLPLFISTWNMSIRSFSPFARLSLWDQTMYCVKVCMDTSASIDVLLEWRWDGKEIRELPFNFNQGLVKLREPTADYGGLATHPPHCPHKNTIAPHFEAPAYEALSFLPCVGSGTLCESLLMLHAFHCNIVMPNKQVTGFMIFLVD